MNRERTETGSASVWVLVCAAVLLVVGAVSVLAASAVAVRHRAETAADLAALAAAGRIGVGGFPCAEAARIAAGNGARLAGCRVALGADGRTGEVRVSVRSTVRLPVVGTRTVVASARAGRLPG